MDEYVYLVEYWYYDNSAARDVISVHGSVHGAETRARELINEQIIDNDDISPETHTAGFSRDEHGMLKVTLNTADLKNELESWTVVRTKLEK